MRVLHAHAGKASLNPYALAQELLAEPGRLTQAIQTIISHGMNGNALVLFLDQMEELFTARGEEQTSEQTNAFLSALYRAVHESALRVIATIRSDFLHHCHQHPEMLKVLNGRSHYGLGRVEPFMLRDMIMKPAQCAGLTISDELVRRIVHDTGSAPAICRSSPLPCGDCSTSAPATI